MFLYEKKLEYPVNIQKKDLKMAKNILAQYGGPDGELAASMRYLNQRFSMPDERGMAVLNDIGCEELNHVEMICAMVMQLMKGATKEELQKADLLGNYTMHDHGLFPVDPNGVPYTATYIETSGDWRADLESDMAAEQRARATYEHLMNETDDPDVLAPLSFLRQREIVHYERFKELRDHYLKIYKNNYDKK